MVSPRSAPIAPPAATPDAPPLDGALLRRAMLGLPLCDEPFAAIGEGLGLSGEAVVERLRELIGQRVIGGIGLAWAPAAAGRLADPAALELHSATESGLPLVQRPYEAVGAMLGWPVAAVCQQLAAWLAAGDLLRIGPTPPADW
jgi:hypothetical protein